MKRLLFRRDFSSYTGGHGKVYDYFLHAAAHEAWQPLIFMAPGSTWDGNPWADQGDSLATRFDPWSADALFLAGMDWTHYPADLPGVPVINLVQGLRHADAAHPLWKFLERKAIRICVSEPVAQAILATRRVRGPVLVVEAGLNLPPAPQVTRHDGIFVDATKQPEIGALIAEAFGNDPRVVVLTTPLPRSEYLARLAGAEIAGLLPFSREGFYLPALEAMALGCAVVVADCVGNRAYLQPGVNALVPGMDARSYIAAIRDLQADASMAANLARGGRRTSDRFGLSRERAVFHSIIDDLDGLWKQT